MLLKLYSLNLPRTDPSSSLNAAATTASSSSSAAAQTQPQQTEKVFSSSELQSMALTLLCQEPITSADCADIAYVRTSNDAVAMLLRDSARTALLTSPLKLKSNVTDVMQALYQAEVLGIVMQLVPKVCSPSSLDRIRSFCEPMDMKDDIISSYIHNCPHGERPPDTFSAVVSARSAFAGLGQVTAAAVRVKDVSSISFAQFAVRHVVPLIFVLRGFSNIVMLETMAVQSLVRHNSGLEYEMSLIHLPHIHTHVNAIGQHCADWALIVECGMEMMMGKNKIISDEDKSAVRTLILLVVFASVNHPDPWARALRFCDSPRVLEVLKGSDHLRKLVVDTRQKGKILSALKHYAKQVGDRVICVHPVTQMADVVPMQMLRVNDDLWCLSAYYR